MSNLPMIHVTVKDRVVTIRISPEIAGFVGETVVRNYDNDSNLSDYITDSMLEAETKDLQQLY